MSNFQAWSAPKLSLHGSVESLTGGDFDEANCEEGLKGPGRADSCTLDGITGLTGSLLG